MIKARPEKRIAVVTHGGFLSRLVDGFYGFENTETREVSIYSVVDEEFMLYR